jgi:hypothetical protein
VKKEPPQPQRQSARLRGVQPSEEDLRPMPVNDHFITSGRSSRVTMDGTVDKLDQSEQDKLLASLKTALDVPNSTPTVYIKEEDKVTGELGDKKLLKQASKLEIKHDWKTVKLTPYRTSACV